MRMITKTNWIVIFVVLAAAMLAVGTASSVSSCCGRPDPAPVIEPYTYAAPEPIPTFATVEPVMISAPVVAARPVVNNCTVQRPAYKMVTETEMREEEITTYETVWDEETRYRTRTVCKRVPETTIHRETVRVSKPVWETIEKETSYDVVRYVSETSEREEVKTVCKPVTEYQEKQIVETVDRPVQETIMQQRTRLVSRPVTTCETRTRDCGEYETQYVEKPGKQYTRLTWQRGGEYYDPATGRTRNRLPGLYWTDLNSAPEYTEQRVYKPRLITETVPVTRMVEESVVEEVPVTVNKIVKEQVVRTEQVPVTRMVEEKIVNKIPITTYKPVTEKVVKKTPVRVCRMETVDEVRETPVTTYKMVTETIEEPYTVRVARQVPKTVKVQRPVTVCRRVPIDACAPVTVSSPEKDAAEPVRVQSPAEPSAKDAAPADTVPQFNSDRSNTSTSNYPSTENESITTDSPSNLPAVPHEAPERQQPEPAPAVPSIALPNAAEGAPPLIEADQVPTLNESTDSAVPAKPVDEQLLPGIKHAEPAPPITNNAGPSIPAVAVSRPKDEALIVTAASIPKGEQLLSGTKHTEPAPAVTHKVKRPATPAAASVPKDEPLKIARTDATRVRTDFGFSKYEQKNLQRPSIPVVAPTQIHPF